MCVCVKCISMLQSYDSEQGSKIYHPKMATSVRDNLSDEIINIRCCFCSQDNRIREAEKYCLDCKDYYCAPCIETHGKFPGTKEHKLLNKSDFGSLGNDGSLPSIPTQRCNLHPLKVLDMFCADHNEVACASCMFLSHRSCTKVQTIPEEIDSMYNKTEFATMKQKIYKTKTTMEEIKKAKERKVTEIKEAYENEVKSVRAFRQELQTLLDSLEQQTIKELKVEYDKIEASLTDEINDINTLIDSMNEVSSQLTKSEGNMVQEFICVKASEKVTAKAEDVEKEQQSNTEETVCFHPDQNIKALLQQFKTLGKVSNNINTVVNTKDGLYKVKHQREIDVKQADDQQVCNIWGSCITEDGCLLLSDNNNRKLKRFDMSTETVTDSISLPANPLAVCLISKTEAVITLDNRTIQFVSLSNRMTATRRLNMNHECWGLAHKDGKLFISEYGKNMYIHDINGQELQKVSTNASGNSIFNYNLHITVSLGGDRLFVADRSNGLVILDIQGKHLSTPTNYSMPKIYGVCTAGKNLFVCSLDSNKIVQIGQDNKLLGEIGKLISPLSLCFDHPNNSLIVTQSHNNKITVLDLD